MHVREGTQRLTKERTEADCHAVELSTGRTFKTDELAPGRAAFGSYKENRKTILESSNPNYFSTS